MARRACSDCYLRTIPTSFTIHYKIHCFRAPSRLNRTHIYSDGVAMSYIFVIPALLCLAALMYFYVLRKPELEPIVGEDHAPVKMKPVPAEHSTFNEWETVLLRALDHIYSGTPSSTGNQMTHVYEPPSELARTAIASLVKAEGGHRRRHQDRPGPCLRGC